MEVLVATNVLETGLFILNNIQNLYLYTCNVNLKECLTVLNLAL